MGKKNQKPAAPKTSKKGDWGLLDAPKKEFRARLEAINPYVPGANEYTYDREYNPSMRRMMQSGITPTAFNLAEHFYERKE